MCDRSHTLTLFSHVWRERPRATDWFSCTVLLAPTHCAYVVSLYLFFYFIRTGLNVEIKFTYFKKIEWIFTAKLWLLLTDFFYINFRDELLLDRRELNRLFRYGCDYIKKMALQWTYILIIRFFIFLVGELMKIIWNVGRITAFWNKRIEWLEIFVGDWIIHSRWM